MDKPALWSVVTTNHQNAEHFGDKPAVARDSRPVFHEFALRALDVVDHVFGVGVDSLDHFATDLLVAARRGLSGRRAQTLVLIPWLPVGRIRFQAR